MSFIKNIFIGIIIGIGFIIPGVSGGALAVILGVYEKIFCSLKTIKDKKSIIFLCALLIGVVLGVIGFGNILLLLIESKEVPTKYIFIGLIIGSIPSFIKGINKKDSESFNPLFFIIAFLISLFLFLLEERGYGFNITEDIMIGNIPFFGLFIAGILYAIGKIVPGISGSALLMLVGMYEYFLKVVANPFLINGKILLSLIPFFIGVVIGLIVLFKLMNYLFQHYYLKTYSAILGFVVGSLLYLYPGFEFNLNGLLCIILLVSSSYLSYILTK